MAQHVIIIDLSEYLNDSVNYNVNIACNINTQNNDILFKHPNNKNINNNNSNINVNKIIESILNELSNLWNVCNDTQSNIFRQSILG